MRIIEFITQPATTTTPTQMGAGQTQQTAGVQTPALQANPIEKQQQKAQIQDQIRQLEKQLVDLRKQLTSIV